MRTWPWGDTRATWAASANVTSAVPPGSRARFSGVWPRLKSRWAMIRGLLIGGLAAAAGAATQSRHAAAATGRPRRPRTDRGCRPLAVRGAQRRSGLARSLITVVPLVVPGWVNSAVTGFRLEPARCGRSCGAARRSCWQPGWLRRPGRSAPGQRSWRGWCLDALKLGCRRRQGWRGKQSRRADGGQAPVAVVHGWTPLKTSCPFRCALLIGTVGAAHSGRHRSKGWVRVESSAGRGAGWALAGCLKGGRRRGLASGAGRVRGRGRRPGCGWPHRACPEYG